jgi:hypothetical protein
MHSMVSAMLDMAFLFSLPPVAAIGWRQPVSAVNVNTEHSPAWVM